MIDSEKIKAEAIGRWSGIFSSLGIDVGDGRHCSCPVCGGKDRFRFDDKEGKGTFFCNSCGAGDGWKLVQNKFSLSFPEALEQVGGIIGSVQVSRLVKEPHITADKMREIFVGSKPISNDPAKKYLSNRGLSVFPATLRYHPSCWESETKKNQKAMLAVFIGADGVAVTMHRTYITAFGEKLDIESPKKILPSLKKMTGGAVRLFPVGETLGVTEGIETAIAASEMMKIPVWAALSSTLLETFEPPKEVKTLVVLADNDRNYAGQKAAYVLANKVVTQKKIEAQVYVPDRTGEDWLDVLVASKQ